MTFSDWQQLTPAAAAREVHQRIQTRLRPGQARAAIAQLASERELAERFAAVPATSPLHGVPFFAKDLFDVAGVPTFAGSTFLPEVRPPSANDGALVRAVKATGAVLAGKTHTHEFAYGITGENPHYGDCELPGFPGRTTGGSSSGSVVVVAAGIVPFALGSDTGGSVRVPGSFGGLFGYRLVPREPWISDAVSLAPSFDTAGWFTANAADMRAATDALIGLRASERAPRGCYLEFGPLDVDVAEAFRNAAIRFAPPAAPAVRDALLRAFAPAVDAYNTRVAVEAWEVHRGWAERYRERYSPVVWQRLNRVHSLTPEQISAADSASVALRAVWADYFKQYDFLVLPASPAPALTKEQCTLENRTRVLTLTTPVSIGGWPVLSIPVPLPSGLTTGLQIVVNDPRSPVVSWALSLVQSQQARHVPA